MGGLEWALGGAGTGLLGGSDRVACGGNAAAPGCGLYGAEYRFYGV